MQINENVQNQIINDVATYGKFNNRTSGNGDLFSSLLSSFKVSESFSALIASTKIEKNNVKVDKTVNERDDHRVNKQYNVKDKQDSLDTKKDSEDKIKDKDPADDKEDKSLKDQDLTLIKVDPNLNSSVSQETSENSTTFMLLENSATSKNTDMNLKNGSVVSDGTLDNNSLGKILKSDVNKGMADSTLVKISMVDEAVSNLELDDTSVILEDSITSKIKDLFNKSSNKLNDILNTNTDNVDLANLDKLGKKVNVENISLSKNQFIHVTKDNSQGSNISTMEYLSAQNKISANLVDESIESNVETAKNGVNVTVNTPKAENTVVNTSLSDALNTLQKQNNKLTVEKQNLVNDLKLREGRGAFEQSISMATSLETSDSSMQNESSSQNDASLMQSNSKLDEAASLKGLQKSLNRSLNMTHSATENAKALYDKVNEMMAKNMRKLTLDLNPENLGKLKIDIEISDDKASKVSFFASVAQTRELISQSISALQELLSEDGIFADSNVQDFESHSSFDGQNQNQNNQNFNEASSGTIYALNDDVEEEITSTVVEDSALSSNNDGKVSYFA